MSVWETVSCWAIGYLIVGILLTCTVLREVWEESPTAKKHMARGEPRPRAEFIIAMILASFAAPVVVFLAVIGVWGGRK